MKWKILPQIFNTVITLVLSFIAVWTVLVSFKLPRTAATILAIIFAAIISGLVFLLSARPSRASLQITRKGQLYALMDKLNICTADEILQIFLPVLGDLHISASATDEHITLSNGQILYCAFFPSPLSDNELMNIYRKYRKDNLIILSNAFSMPCYSLAKKLKIKLFSIEDIYSLLEDAKALPEQNIAKTPPFYDGMFSRLFARKNGARFIFLGLTLIIIAFAVFYPIYYYVAGILSITYGFTCLIFAKNNIYLPESLKDALTSPSKQ